MLEGPRCACEPLPGHCWWLLRKKRGRGSVVGADRAQGQSRKESRLQECCLGKKTGRQDSGMAKWGEQRRLVLGLCIATGSRLCYGSLILWGWVHNPSRDFLNRKPPGL